MHVSNKYSKSGAQVAAKRKVSLVSKIELRTSWIIFGIDMIHTKHNISLCTIISRIVWEDVDGKMQQLYQLVDSTCNYEGTIFGWYPQFGNQAQVVMAGSLPYLE